MADPEQITTPKITPDYPTVLSHKAKALAKKVALNNLTGGGTKKQSLAHAAGYRNKYPNYLESNPEFRKEVDINESEILAAAGVPRDKLLEKFKRMIDAEPIVTPEMHKDAVFAGLRANNMLKADREKDGGVASIIIVMGDGIRRPDMEEKLLAKENVKVVEATVVESKDTDNDPQPPRDAA